MMYRDASSFSAELPMELRDALEREREPGEQLLWAGQPEPGRAVRAEWLLFAFAIPWTAFSVFWECMAIGITLATIGKGGAFGLIFVLFGLPFVGIGFWMLSRPFAALADARRTVYAATNQRLLSITRKRGGQVTLTAVPRHASDISRTERPDGSGDLTFAPAPPRARSYPSGSQLASFYGIKNVHEVERMVRQTFFGGSDGEHPARQSFGVGEYFGGR